MSKIDDWIANLERLRQQLDQQRSLAEASMAAGSSNAWERDAALTLKAGVR